MEIMPFLYNLLSNPLLQALVTLIGGVTAIGYFFDKYYVETVPPLEKLYFKSLAINQSLGRKDGVARDYADLGNFYKKLGKLQRAKAMYLKSLKIYKEMGDSHADLVQQWLEELKVSTSSA